jgi:hypothetical protein
MLMQPDIVNQIFPGDSAFVDWITAGDKRLKSAVADYHTYGRFLVENFPRRVQMGKWNNKAFVWDSSMSLAPGQIVEKISKEFWRFSSASSHRYLERR